MCVTTAPSPGRVTVLALLLSLSSSAAAFSLNGVDQDDLSLKDVSEFEPRVFFANYTSSLLAVNSTILLYALGGAGIVAAVILALYLLANAPARSTYGYGQGYSEYSEYDSGARGFREGRSGYDVLTLISVATDLYGKLTYDDIDCQKKIICEFMDEPEMFGSGASRVKTGVQYAASWLAPLGFSIVDQISEAAQLDSKGARNCDERFKSCGDISLKKTVAEKSLEVRAVTKVMDNKKEQAKKEESKKEESKKEESKKEESKKEEYEYYYDEK